MTRFIARVFVSAGMWSSLIQFAEAVAIQNIPRSVFSLGVFITSLAFAIAVMEKLDGQERADEGNRPVR